MTNSKFTTPPIANRKRRDLATWNLERAMDSNAGKHKIARMWVAGWSIVTIGTALWLYGYFTRGTQAFVDWPASVPWWIADFVPNMEAEIGLLLVLVGTVAIYSPTRPR